MDFEEYMIGVLSGILTEKEDEEETATESKTSPCSKGKICSDDD